MAVVTAKTGRPLPPGQILAEKGEKGVLREVLGEGRHFLDPVNNEWKVVPATTIPLGSVGVVTSKVGKELPPGDILAPDDLSRASGAACSAPAPTASTPRATTSPSSPP